MQTTLTEFREVKAPSNRILFRVRNINRFQWSPSTLTSSVDWHNHVVMSDMSSLHFGSFRPAWKSTPNGRYFKIHYYVTALKRENIRALDDRELVTPHQALLATPLSTEY